MKALIEDFACADTTDAQLATAAQAGSAPAFEALFRRYRPRIAAFVRGSVPDDGRVDDVVQEVFFSALRKLRTLESPEAFAPWLHRIARNACIDHLRRVSREEIAIDSHHLEAADGRPMRPPTPSIHAHVARKEDIEHLQQAFGELPDAQHQALVLRELEGLSYDEIGRRLRLSRPAVESILFRARRGLKGEFNEISSGARCVRVRSAMAGWTEGIGAGRERRVAMRHLRACQGCRREAAAMGLHGVAHEAAQSGALHRAIDRAAAVIPLPFVFFRRGAESGTAGASAGASGGVTAQAQNALMQLSVAGHAGADQAASLAQKALAIVATVAVVGGGGMAVKNGSLHIPIPNVTGSGSDHDKAAAVRPNGLPADPQKAAEVLYGGQGRGPVPANAEPPPLVVPAPVVNALPQEPPAVTMGAGDPSPSAGGGNGSGTTSPSESSPAVTAPVVETPAALPVATQPPSNGNGNGNGNGHGNGHGKNKKNASTTPAPPPVPAVDPAPAPVPVDPVPDPVAPSGDSAAADGSNLGVGAHDHIPPGQLKKITGAKKAKG